MAGKTSMTGGRRLRLGLALGAIIATTACVASYRNHGYIPSEDELADIVIGVDTRASVQENVGTPSSSGLLDDGDYFYVQSRVRSFAYRRPEVVTREVLAISFDQVGVVSNIERFGLEDGQLVVLERRVTDNGTTDVGLLRQILGNFGRFAAPNL